jgi:PAS domain S-box-containing protein
VSEKGSTKKILLVEDEAVTALNEAELLTKNGFDVYTVHTADKAIETIERQAVDCIVIDIELGKASIDGAETARTILRNHDFPIVFLTCHAEREYVEKVKSLTYYGYILKDSGEPVLIESINTALNLFASKKEREKAENITKFKETETALKESEQRYRLLFENANESIVIFQDGQTKMFNKKTLEITGYSAEEYREITISDLVHPKDREKVLDKHQKRIKGEIDDESYEYRIITKSGAVKWLRMHPTIVEWEGKPACLGLIEDITRRKHAEEMLKESEEKYRDIFNNSLVSLWEEDISSIRKFISDLRHKGVTDFKDYFNRHPDTVRDLVSGVEIVNVNETTLTWYGADSKDDLLGSLEKVFVFSEEGLAKFKTELIAIAEGNRTVEKEVQGKTVDGRTLDLLMRIAIPSTEAQRDNMLVAVTDITSQKKIEAELKKSNRDKEFLMKELNHRVKNNLIMIQSLLNLKNSALGNSVDLSDVLHQIDAIRIVHGKLSQSEDITHIDAKEYLHDLLDTLFTTFSSKAVLVEYDIDDIPLHTRTAVPVGLVTNEIAINAIKHGFTDGKEHRFSISLKEDPQGENYILTLSNTGQSFPEDVDLDNPKTLGLRLISAIVSQLNGTVTLVRKPHPEFTIRFPGEKNRQ